MERLKDLKEKTLPRRVVITGIGLVTPLGVGVKENWQSLKEGTNGIERITRFDVSEYQSQIAGEVKNFDPLDFIDKKELRKMDRFIQYALAASQLAAEDSEINVSLLEGERTGVFIGSGIGGIGGIEETHKTLLEKGPNRVSPFFLISTIINEAAGYVSIKFRSRGPNLANATACSTGTHAIGASFKIIARGDADIMLAGGAEAPITPLGMSGFCAMRALSVRNDEPQTASRPFDATRDGFVVSEGAAVLVLEEMEAAMNRGAKIYAEIIGYGTSGDAYHPSAPCLDGVGAFLSMRNALNDGGIQPDLIDYINAHGTSTPWNDKIETLAIKKLFLEHAKKLYVSSTKSMTGHLLGAAGGLEIAAVALSLKDQIIPPTINYKVPDPECDLDYVPNTSRSAKLEYALSNSFGFGGTNGTLLLKKVDY